MKRREEDKSAELHALKGRERTPTLGLHMTVTDSLLFPSYPGSDSLRPELKKLPYKREECDSREMLLSFVNIPTVHS